MKARMLLGMALVGLFLGSTTHAEMITEVDEFGNSIGTFGSIISNDPGPGGLNNVLTYILPGFRGTQGDVFFGEETGVVRGGDVIRFNGNGTLIPLSAHLHNLL